MTSADRRIALEPLQPEDRERFIADNQEAFNYSALEEFGRRDNHFEEDGQIISRKTIENAIDEGEALRIVEFFNSHHPDPNEPEHSGSRTPGDEASEGGRPNDSVDGMFRFEKLLH